MVWASTIKDIRQQPPSRRVGDGTPDFNPTTMVSYNPSRGRVGWGHVILHLSDEGLDGRKNEEEDDNEGVDGGRKEDGGGLKIPHSNVNLVNSSCGLFVEKLPWDSHCCALCTDEHSPSSITSSITLVMYIQST